jgi:hypothetical protein
MGQTWTLLLLGDSRLFCDSVRVGASLVSASDLIFVLAFVCRRNGKKKASLVFLNGLIFVLATFFLCSLMAWFFYVFGRPCLV